ncbi:hypothetical protein KHA90_21680 [Flavobacterium psychroterrae]|uniref:SMI1/KNR4 family protein n=1 Tax=Flavobacterium psychroterrae TaxID=2133767 RepID=A0ABS5PH37_9FLAO|nr:hypothetical protein [Flavobacterium psychroterrae]MBS7233629.1 hypothetical protein [Flavobacterium psychroterrae]
MMNLKNKEIYDYIIPRSELRISVNKNYVVFFDLRPPQEEEDFSWTFNEFIDFMEAFKDFISKHRPTD